MLTKLRYHLGDRNSLHSSMNGADVGQWGRVDSCPGPSSPGLADSPLASSRLSEAWPYARSGEPQGLSIGRTEAKAKPWLFDAAHQRRRAELTGSGGSLKATEAGLPADMSVSTTMHRISTTSRRARSALEARSLRHTHTLADLSGLMLDGIANRRTSRARQTDKAHLIRPDCDELKRLGPADLVYNRISELASSARIACVSENSYRQFDQSASKRSLTSTPKLVERPHYLFSHLQQAIALQKPAFTDKVSITK